MAQRPVALLLDIPGMDRRKVNFLAIDDADIRMNGDFVADLGFSWAKPTADVRTAAANKLNFAIISFVSSRMLISVRLPIFWRSVLWTERSRRANLQEI